jgi:hypothetical protein
MKKIFAVYEKKPSHQKEINGIILSPFNTYDEAKEAMIKFGYGNENYYVDVSNKDEIRLYEFMCWVNNETNLQYTIVGIERMVKKYLKQ